MWMTVGVNVGSVEYWKVPVTVVPSPFTDPLRVAPVAETETAGVVVTKVVSMARSSSITSCGRKRLRFGRCGSWPSVQVAVQTSEVALRGTSLAAVRSMYTRHIII